MLTRPEIKVTVTTSVEKATTSADKAKTNVKTSEDKATRDTTNAKARPTLG